MLDHAPSPPPAQQSKRAEQQTVLVMVQAVRSEPQAVLVMVQAVLADPQALLVMDQAVMPPAQHSSLAEPSVAAAGASSVAAPEYPTRHGHPPASHRCCLQHLAAASDVPLSPTRSCPRAHRWQLTTLGPVAALSVLAAAALAAVMHPPAQIMRVDIGPALSSRTPPHTLSPTGGQELCSQRKLAKHGNESAHPAMYERLG